MANSVTEVLTEEPAPFYDRWELFSFSVQIKGVSQEECEKGGENSIYIA